MNSCFVYECMFYICWYVYNIHVKHYDNDVNCILLRYKKFLPSCLHNVPNYKLTKRFNTTRPTCFVIIVMLWKAVHVIINMNFSSDDEQEKLVITNRVYSYVIMVPLHKICVWTQIRKIKRKSLTLDFDWLKINLSLIFLICVQTQILCNGVFVINERAAEIFPISQKSLLFNLVTNLCYFFCFIILWKGM